MDLYQVVQALQSGLPRLLVVLDSFNAFRKENGEHILETLNEGLVVNGGKEDSESLEAGHSHIVVLVLEAPVEYLLQHSRVLHKGGIVIERELADDLDEVHEREFDVGVVGGCHGGYHSQQLLLLFLNQRYLVPSGCRALPGCRSTSSGRLSSCPESSLTARSVRCAPSWREITLRGWP